MYFTKIIIKKTLYTLLEGCRVHEKHKKKNFIHYGKGKGVKSCQSMLHVLRQFLVSSKVEWCLPFWISSSELVMVNVPANRQSLQVLHVDTNVGIPTPEESSYYRQNLYELQHGVKSSLSCKKVVWLQLWTWVYSLFAYAGFRSDSFFPTHDGRQGQVVYA